jgi:hypothetical protein
VEGRPIAAVFAPDQMPPWGREEVVLSIRDENLVRGFINTVTYLPQSRRGRKWRQAKPGALG